MRRYDLNYSSMPNYCLNRNNQRFIAPFLLPFIGGAALGYVAGRPQYNYPYPIYYPMPYNQYYYPTYYNN